MSLLGSYVDANPRPKLLTYGDLPHTVDCAVRANRDDPMGLYMDDTPDNHDGESKRKRRTTTSMYLSFSDCIRRREAWTINHGDSILLYTPAPVTVPRGRRWLNTIIAGFIKAILSIYKLTFTQEQKKRRAELREKLAPAVARALGDRVPELISLDGLSTAPEKQGLGYAGSLVNRLAAMADAQSRGIWLLTNLCTTGFYARFGFKVVESISLGEDNPTWEKGPVIACIMLREPVSPSTQDKISEIKR